MRRGMYRAAAHQRSRGIPDGPGDREKKTALPQRLGRHRIWVFASGYRPASFSTVRVMTSTPMGRASSSISKRESWCGAAILVPIIM